MGAAEDRAADISGLTRALPGEIAGQGHTLGAARGTNDHVRETTGRDRLRDCAALGAAHGGQ